MYASYDERTYCMTVMRTKKPDLLRCNFTVSIFVLQVHYIEVFKAHLESF